MFALDRDHGLDYAMAGLQQQLRSSQLPDPAQQKRAIQRMYAVMNTEPVPDQDVHVGFGLTRQEHDRIVREYMQAHADQDDDEDDDDEDYDHEELDLGDDEETSDDDDSDHEHDHLHDHHEHFADDIIPYDSSIQHAACQDTASDSHTDGMFAKDFEYLGAYASSHETQADDLDLGMRTDRGVFPVYVGRAREALTAPNRQAR